MRRYLVQTAAAVLIFLLTAEIAVRVVHPAPRVQIVKGDDQIHVFEQDGVVLWTGGGPKMEQDACAKAPASALHAVFVGSSILGGSGVQGPQVFTELLRARLPGDDVCIDNLALPAFTGEQKRVTAMAALARERAPDVLFWEVWENDFGDYERFGDGAAINLFGYSRDAAGYPTVPLVPAPVHHLLFDHSAAWRYGVLALAVDHMARASMAELRKGEIKRDLEPVLARAAERGTTVILVVCPMLNRPFVESITHPHLGYEPVWAFARDRGLRLLRLEQLLEHEDVIAMRADPCCHYSPLGHERLATAFEAELLTIRAQRDNAPLSE